MQAPVDIAEQFEKHLNSPRQTWLLGAGVSFPANIPLMYPLTERVIALARSDAFAEDAQALKVLQFIIDDCPPLSHIEHYLTHLGDLISIAERSRTGGMVCGGERIPKEKLVEVHGKLVEQIASTVRWGYRPASKDSKGAIVAPEIAGTAPDSIVEINQHKAFIQAVFGPGRAGLDFLRSPIEFFTTNYDTLLEDALALLGVEFQDGFVGGGVGFWNVRNYEPRSETRALVTKLHGSIDWYHPRAGGPSLLRVRYGDTYPGAGGAVMIYPQATKYINTQRDPFAELFQRFRRRLSNGSDHVLLICGYSFGDEHINAEIEAAMEAGKSQLTIIAFTAEPGGELPPVLRQWQGQYWSQRLFIASPKGLYQGGSVPSFPAPSEDRDWWTFEGATKLFAEGLPKDIQEAIA